MPEIEKFASDSIFTDAEKNDIEQKVIFELHDTECKMIKVGGIANVLGGLFIVWVLYNQIKPVYLISWYAILFLMNALNVILAFYYQSNHPEPTEIKSRLKVFYFVMGILCLTLGSIGILFISTDLAHQLFIIVFLLIILISFSFGTVANFTESLICIGCLLTPSIFFHIYLGISSGGKPGNDPDLNLVFAISFLIVAAFLLAASYIAHQLIRKSFRLFFINTLLNEKLEDANKFLENRVKERTVELEKSFELVKYQSTHDLLTHLPNQRLLIEHISVAIKFADQNKHMLAVFFLGLNEMEKINDGLGHRASSFTVRTISRRLKKSFADQKISQLRDVKCTLFLSRRDEFVILVNPLFDLSIIEVTGSHFFSLLEEPIYINGRAVKLTASIGVSVYPNDGQNVRSLLMNADAAMMSAKRWGGNKLKSYKTELNADVSRQLDIENHLHNALKNNEFRLYYQPFVDLRTGKICGMEALLRWKSPELGFISPMDFILLAEANGIIIPLGEWVLRSACAQTKIWHAQGFSTLKVAINLSAKQLQQKNIIEVVDHILKEINLESRYVELELTETEAFKEEGIPVLEEFKKMGLGLSIDDFGTGYSGLTNLKLVDIDKLKIDKYFVQDIDTNSDSKVIVSNTIALAKKMGITVLAEGVETKEQLAFLRENGCDMIQGYYFSPPVTADAFTELLLNNQSL